MADQNNPFIKAKRVVDVSTTLGGMVARVIGEKYLGLEVNDQAYAQTLKNSLGQIKGPLMKVAQFLATIPDAIPFEYSQALLELQTQAPSMSGPFVNRRMVGELGVHWQQKFQNFEMQPSFAASLGQVHKARSLNGQDIACKLQYPNMQATLETDLQQLKAFLSFYKPLQEAIDVREIMNEIRERLEEELDYNREAQNIKNFSKTLHSFKPLEDMDCHASFHGARNDRNRTHHCEHSEAIQKVVLVPKVIPELSTNKLLTMEWAQGRHILEFVDAPIDIRNHLADLLFYAWYFPFYHYGYLHGDPHPGNYLVTPDHQIYLLDFGCVRYFEKDFIKGVLELYLALLHNDKNRAVEAYKIWGFSNLNNDLIDILNQWARLLYEPILEDKMRPIQTEYSGAKGWQTAQQVYEALRKAGGVRPPKTFVFMDRATVGLGGVFMRLKVERNWHQLFNQVVKWD